MVSPSLLRVRSPTKLHRLTRCSELNMMEIRPPGLDPSGRKRYPVLLSVYGGPGSQQVSNKFKRDWSSYLACEKKYIIVIIDPRGTGFKGRKQRNPVRDNLGHYEVLDFIKTAGELGKRSYVDSRRIGIWGWVSPTCHEDLQTYG